MLNKSNSKIHNLNLSSTLLKNNSLNASVEEKELKESRGIYNIEQDNNQDNVLNRSIVEINCYDAKYEDIRVKKDDNTFNYNNKENDQVNIISPHRNNFNILSKIIQTSTKNTSIKDKLESHFEFDSISSENILINRVPMSPKSPKFPGSNSSVNIDTTTSYLNILDRDTTSTKEISHKTSETSIVTDQKLSFSAKEIQSDTI